MQVEVDEEDISSGKATQKKRNTIKITTPDIINGQVKSIFIKNEQYHTVNLSFSKGSTSSASNEGMDIDEQQFQNLSDSHAESKNQGSGKLFDQFDF